jgi:hypothetical protein
LGHNFARKGVITVIRITLSQANYDAMAKQIAAVIQWTKKILVNTTEIQIKFLSLDIQQEDILVLWQ